MHRLNELITALETKIPQFDISNQAVSTSTIGWHIEHSLLVINGIIGYLSKSNPDDYKWTFNFKRMFIFATQKIPRGQAKSPKVVDPKEQITSENLIKHLAKTRESINLLSSMDKNKFFEHPFFGKLKLKQTIHFLEIHTKHHLNIIHDIAR